MTLARYITGFVFSLVLTGLSFGAVWLHYYTNHQYPTHHDLFVWILLLAVIQVLVQIMYFLHIGRTSRTRDVLAIVFAALLVVIVVGGALWIMTNLNSRMTPSEQDMIQYMQAQSAAL